MKVRSINFVSVLLTLVSVATFQGCTSATNTLGTSFSNPNGTSSTPSPGAAIQNFSVTPSTNPINGSISFTVTDSNPITSVYCVGDTPAYAGPANNYPCTAGSKGTYTFSYSNFYATQHTLTVIATDSANNQQQTTFSWNITLNVSDQISAATWTAQNNYYCNGSYAYIGNFYWEVGDGQGSIAGGQVVPSPTPGASPVPVIDRNYVMDVDSASKFIFGTYAVQQMYSQGVNVLDDPVSTKFLHMAAGYASFQDTSCTAANSTLTTSSSATVLNCFNTCCALDKKGGTAVYTPSGSSTSTNILCAPGLTLADAQALPGNNAVSVQCNNTYTPSYDGFFYYGGGHFADFAVNTTVNAGAGPGPTPYGLNPSLANHQAFLLSPTGPNMLAETISNTLGLFSTFFPNPNANPNTFTFAYTFPDLAGGVHTNAANYASILQSVLNSKSVAGSMYHDLGQNPICTWQSSLMQQNPNLYTIPNNLKSEPLWFQNSSASNCPAVGSPINYEALHYSYNHWVEDDPENGDGTFSSPGKAGFYPWIDRTKSYYGLVARYDGSGAQSTSENSQIGQGWNSLLCGRQIRAAFMTATPLQAPNQTPLPP